VRLPALLLLAAVACGGGGGDSGPSGPPAASAIALSASTITLTGVGTENTLSATLSPAGATGTIVWRTVDPAIATVSGSGSSATVRAVAGGATQVIASVGSIESRASVNVVPAVKRITLPAGTASVRVGSATTLVATVEADAGANSALQWSSGSTAVATVSASGVVTGLSVGTSVITVSSTAFPSISTTTTITVTPLAVRTVTLSPPASSIAFPGTQQITATLDADAGASQTLDWSSSAPGIATVSASGLVTGVGPGTATITARSQQTPTVSGTATVTVTFPAVTVNITPVNPRVLVGATQALTATVTAGAGIATTVTWGTTAPLIAQVNASGVVSAIAPGTATITATSTANPTVSATTTVTVAAPGVTAIVLSPTTSGVVVGSTRTLSATITSDNGANTALDWTTSNPAIATVNSAGDVSGVAAGGPVTITARSVATPSISASATITVIGFAFNTVWNPTRSGAGGAFDNQPSVWLWNGGLNTAMVLGGFQAGNLGASSGTWILAKDGVTSDVTPADARTVYPTADLSGNSATDIMVLRTNGTTQRWNGTSFESITWPLPTANNIPTSVSAAGGGIYWATRRPDDIMKFDGTQWTVVRAGDASANSVRILALSPTKALIRACLNIGGSVPPQELRLINGATLSTIAALPQNSGCRPDLTATSESDVMMATDQGVARWDGSTWTYISAGLPVNESITNTTICGANRFAVATNARVYQIQGTTLVPITQDGEAGTRQGFGEGPRISCANDGTLRMASGFRLLTRRTANGWVDEHYGPDFNAVHLASRDRGVIAGTNVVYDWTPSGARMRWRTGAIQFIGRAAWSEPDGSAWVGGDLSLAGTGERRGLVLFFSGSTVRYDTIPGVNGVMGLWKSGGVMYALGGSPVVGGAGTLLRRVGTTWEVVSTEASSLFSAIDGVSNFALAISNGAMRRFDGTTWTSVAGPVRPASKLYVPAVNTAFAGTCQNSNDAILRYNGTAWTELNTSAVGSFNCVLAVWGTSASDVYAAVGFSSPRVIHFDGTTWTNVSIGSTSRVNAAAGVAGLSLLVGNLGYVNVGTPPGAAVRSMR
jgi:uncharacterized protein YjdB